MSNSSVSTIDCSTAFRHSTIAPGDELLLPFHWQLDALSRSAPRKPLSDSRTDASDNLASVPLFGPCAATASRMSSGAMTGTDPDERTHHARQAKTHSGMSSRIRDDACCSPLAKQGFELDANERSKIAAQIASRW
jgi:hypothetical protein